MRRYHYKAIDKEGRLVKGALTAENPLHLESLLRSQQKELVQASRFRRSFFSLNTSSSFKILEFFVQWQGLLKAKIPVTEALKSLQEEWSLCHFKQILEEIIFQVENGQMLSVCFSKYPKVFNDVCINLIRVGEETGALDEALSHLILYLTYQQSLKDKTQKALAYPIFLCSFLMMTLWVLFSFLVPQIVMFFSSLNTELPLMTQLLLSFSTFLGEYTWGGIVFLGGILGGSIFLRYFHTPTDLFLSSLVFKIPVMGKVIKTLILMRFFNVFFILSKANIDMLKALDVSIHVVGNHFLKDFLTRARTDIQNGQKLSTFFINQVIISPFVYRMIRMGEQTGSLINALEHIHSFYEREVDLQSSFLLRVLEPCLLLILGGILTWLALGVFYPLYTSFTIMDF